MTPLTPEALDNIDRLGVAPDRATVLALVAECRELRRLRSELADVHALDALACRHGTRLDIPAEIPGFDPGDGSDHIHFVLMPIGARSRRAALEYLAKEYGWKEGT